MVGSVKKEERERERDRVLSKVGGGWIRVSRRKCQHAPPEARLHVNE